jgi:Ca2+-binding RTX toxin-like protein
MPIKGDGKDNTLLGTSGNDEMWGLGGNDILKGGGGHDTLDGGKGEDTMAGGLGDDTYIVDDVKDKVIEGDREGRDLVQSSVTFTLGANVENLILTGSSNIDGHGNELNNIMVGNSGQNDLYGGDGSDKLKGGGGDDYLHGGSALGDDILDGGAGADVMLGGTGNDRYYVDQSGDQIFEYANGGYDGVYSTMTYTLGAELENLWLQGNGNIDGGGNGADNQLYGNDGNNMLFGYAGNDFLDGGAGADSMWGGEDADTYIVNSANDQVFETGTQGNDEVYVGDLYLDYTMAANIEILHLYGYGKGTGNELNNYMYGGIANNVFDGGLGRDRMEGALGDDTYIVDNTSDEAFERQGEGNDTVFASANYALLDHVEVLSLASGTATYGTGNAQANTIYGNTGDNVLNGAGGADALNGLGGNDNFVFHVGEANGDTVYDFEGNGAGVGDFIYFIGYGTVAQGATFQQLNATQWQVNSADGLLHETITFIGGTGPDASDFVLI